MDFYYTPNVCSLATRVTLYDSGLEQETNFHHVGFDKKINGQGDYRQISPQGFVPALKTRQDRLLTESMVILQYLADLVPEQNLAPPLGSYERYELQRWLSFIGTEMHSKSVSPAVHPLSPKTVQDHVLQNALPSRLSILNEHLLANEYLMGEQYTIADAYLFAMFHILRVWKQGKVDLSPWPAVKSYEARLSERPSVARAVKEELGEAYVLKK